MRAVDSPAPPVVAILVDSRRSEYLLAERTILRGLLHWGVAHEIVDLAQGDPAPRAARAGVLLVGQEYLGESLGPHLPALEGLVGEGRGWVNVDHALMTYPAAHRQALDLDRDGEETSVEGLTIASAHPITASHRSPGGTFRCKQPLPALRVRPGRATTLVTDEQEAPLLVTGTLGAGRVVQWLVSPKLWNPGYLGLAHGLDGLLWRSLVWSCPSPMPMNAMPPFTRFRFDDCNGHWRTPADLAFVDELNRRGHSPSICFCLRALSDDAAAYLGERQRTGRVDLAPHTLAPGTSLFFGDAGGEYDERRFELIFDELDDAAERWNVRWSSILSDHEHEWSRRAVPHLRARNIRHKMNITLPGSRWTDPHVDWRPDPYGSMSYALSALPGDLSDFFAVFNHHPSFESARVYIDPETFIYHRPGGFGKQKWDFLNGLVRGPEAADKDLGAATERIVEHSRVGLDALFFGGSITHSHFTRHLRPEEWGRILDDADRKLDDLEQIPASYDSIAAYAEARAATRLVDVGVDGSSLRCTYSGRTEVPLRLSVFEVVGERIVRREYPVEPFAGESVVEAPVEASR